MKPKQYAAKYKDNFDVVAISEDLADDYKVYLKLHEGAMTCTRFRIGAKEIFDKIKNVSRWMELTTEQHSILAKYFYAKIILPSYRMYWRNDQAYYYANREEHRSNERAKINDVNRRRNEEVSARSRQSGGKVTPNMFSYHGVIASYTNFAYRSQCNTSRQYDESSFYTYIKLGVKVPFDIETDVAFYEASARPNQTKRHGYGRDIDEALAFLGLTDDTNITSAQIKSSYRAMSKIHHPDVGGDTAMFIKLTGYVDILTKYFAAA